MATQRTTRSMSSGKQSTTFSSYSLPPSPVPEPVTSISSVEPHVTPVYKIPSGDPLKTFDSKIPPTKLRIVLMKPHNQARGVEPFTGNPLDPDPNNSIPENPQKDVPLTPPESDFNMDLGEFLKDRLDGHVTSYPRRTTHPWPTGLYPAIPKDYDDNLKGHQFIWAESPVIEKKKLKTKPQSLQNLEDILTRLRWRSNRKRKWTKEERKQTRAFKRSLRAHRFRIEKLACCKLPGLAAHHYQKRT